MVQITHSSAVEVEPRTSPSQGWWHPSDGLRVLSLLAALQVLQAALYLTSRGDFRGSVTGRLAADFFPTVLTAATVLLLAGHRGMRYRDLGFVLPKSWRPALYAWAAAMVVGPAYALLLKLAGWESPLASPASIALPSGTLAATAFSVVAVAPVVEEIIFRGVVFRGIRARWPLLPALMVTGLLFAGFHLSGPQLIPLAVIGALFSYAYERTGSLWSSIVAHAGLNAMWLIAALILATITT